MDNILDRYDDMANQNQNNIMCKLNGQLIDGTSSTTSTTSVVNVYTPTTTASIAKD